MPCSSHCGTCPLATGEGPGGTARGYSRSCSHGVSCWEEPAGRETPPAHGRPGGGLELGTPCCYNPVGQGALMTRELLRCPNSHLAAPAKGPLQLPCPTLLVAKAMMAAGAQPRLSPLCPTAQPRRLPGFAPAPTCLPNPQRCQQNAKGPELHHLHQSRRDASEMPKDAALIASTNSIDLPRKC